MRRSYQPVVTSPQSPRMVPVEPDDPHARVGSRLAPQIQGRNTHPTAAVAACLIVQCFSMPDRAVTGLENPAFMHAPGVPDDHPLDLLNTLNIKGDAFHPEWNYTIFLALTR